MNDDHGIDRLLRGADPVAGLPDLPADRIHDLTEHAMTAPAPARAPFPVRRVAIGGGALVGLAAAVAVAVPLLAGPGATTTLRGPAGAAGVAAVCAPVADFLGDAEVAFRAEATSVEGRTVTLRVLQRYAGDVEGAVTVPQGRDGGVDGDLPVFVRGEDYLVAARDGRVLGCGGTGADSPALRAVYDRAFAGR